MEHVLCRELCRIRLIAVTLRKNREMEKLKDIKIAEYDYELPAERIALHPLTERAECKLLVRAHGGELNDRCFKELPKILPTDSLLVYNNTKVINARLHFRKYSGARIEVFCLEPCEPLDYAQNFASRGSCSWICFVGNSKRWKSGELSRLIRVGDREFSLKAERGGQRDNAWVVNFRWDSDEVSFSEIVDAVGEIPIPPYLNRDSEDADREDYQTVFSRIEGSVAAPTAGLHFTPELLDEIDAAGIERRELTLHVGAGTFKPVSSETIGEHQMHREFIEVSRELIRELANTERHIIAVGTTSVRTLESLFHFGCRVIEGKEPNNVEQWEAYESRRENISRGEALTALADWLESKNLEEFVASTGIMIVPGYRFKVVEGMVTNFHQPQSTLLLLVSAFTGGDWKRMYEHALAGGYRFLSYGDAELLL